MICASPSLSLASHKSILYPNSPRVPCSLGTVALGYGVLANSSLLSEWTPPIYLP